MKNGIQFLLGIQCISIIGINAYPLIGSGIKTLKTNKFPFIVALGDAPAETLGDHFCVGTLISKRHVLTARHCIRSDKIGQAHKNLADVKVIIGSYDVLKGTQYGVEAFKTYEEWAKEHQIELDGLYHDIAVATLDEDVKGVKPVKLSRLNDKQLYGKKVVTAGWGTTDDDKVPRYLQTAQLDIIYEKDAVKNFEAVKKPAHLVKNHLCTTKKSPVCLGNGDSGCPILHKNKLVGVSSYVSPDDITHPNVQNGHQSVYYYREFIESFTKNSSSPPDDQTKVRQKFWRKIRMCSVPTSVYF